MPLIEYVSKRFSAAARSIIDTANDIIQEYQKQGFDLTLRQLYYQFVSRDIIANQQKEYKRLGDIINDARLAGLVDWEAIVDRTRELRGNSHWETPHQILEVCVKQFQIDKWNGQPKRVEVWIEKDALVGVIERTCRALDVAFFSCRGYTSQSEMWVGAQRLLEYARAGQHTTVLHFGDHDPSGLDMTRDIQDRLALFFSQDEFDSPTVKRVALTMKQVEQYNPPPNPAKITDTRAGKYIAEHGDESWELDALEPTVIDALIRREVLKLRDEDLWNESVKKEKAHIAQLTKAAKGFKD